jgi:prepilin-type processing-associated H-X9-DG protein
MNFPTLVRKGGRAVRSYSGSKQTAFTVIELLVVPATIALLAMTLLPALAGTQVQSKVLACKARFRQWAVSANLYANDNRGWLPSFAPNGGGDYAWDVGTNMINALYPYGMDVSDWFCPMRPNELDAVNVWGQAQLGHPIQSIYDLERYWGGAYASEISLNDNYWVPRAQSTGTQFPTDYSGHPQAFWPPWLKNQPTLPASAIYGWPQRLHDRAVPYVPFVSDSAASGLGNGLSFPHPASPYTTNIAPSTAHFVNGTLIGVNLAFADGHVESHSPSQMRAAYFDGGNYWFY